MKNSTEKVVFVDCFNTLIGRTKTPNSVLFDWGRKMNEHFSNISPIEFYRLFKQHWRLLEKDSIRKIENFEFLITTKEIFSYIHDSLTKYDFNINLNKENFVELAQKEYFEVEHKSHYLKKKTVKIIEKQVKSGKKCYIVSDFYCDSTAIKDWLKALNFDINLITEIFVSCEFKKSKKQGSLFEEVLKKLNIQGKQALMIGDNLLADIKNARKQKIKTKWIFPQIKKDCKEIRRAKTKLQIPEEYKQIFNKDLYCGSYANYAFPLYLFTKRVAEDCLKRNVKNIFFLAREGNFLKKLFDEYCSFYKLDIKSHYFSVSRRSALRASTLPYDVAFIGLKDYFPMTIASFMKTLGFTKEETAQVCKENKARAKRMYIDFGKTKMYKKIMNSKSFNEIYKRISGQQHVAFDKYLKSFGVDVATEGFVLVDSGWGKTMQRYIHNAFENQNIDISGYYLGCVNKDCIEKQTYGLLFTDHLKLGLPSKVFSHRKYNYEEILRSNEGTCLGYDVETGKAILADNPKEMEGFKIIKPMQDMIFAKFLEILKVDSVKFYPIESISAKMFYDLVKKTNKKDSTFFVKAQQTYYDSFGFVGFSYQHFSNMIRKINFWFKDKFYVLRYRRAVNKKRDYWE